MSDQQLSGAASMIGGGESSDSLVEVNVKTLDSQVFSFQVDKNMLVSAFKEKIESKVGLPVAQQRLIFRGKVLKDEHTLSEYHVDNGHTLHLVVRQPSESQPPSNTSPGEASANNGQDPNAAGLPNRFGMSHSVVLGTLNVGDQGEGTVPDISRVIGAVLNTIGIGGQTATNPMGAVNVMGGSQNNVQFYPPVQVPQGYQTEGPQNNIGTQSQAGGVQAQPGQTFPSRTIPQVVHVPIGAALQIPMGPAIPVPSLNVPIPDSLHTLFEFMSRMETAFSHNGSHPNDSQINDGDRPALNLPSNIRGLPTPEALMTILRHAQRLLGDHAVAALSHIAGRLDQEGSSTDSAVRSQIQSESVQLGLAMQHLGALLLELGRTILTLRMGQSPAEAYVNAGPAVYISSSGPNPIMVQPFPLQTNSLFGGSAAPLNSGNLGPVGIGTAPRHVNIHIHTAVGPRPISNADETQGERSNRSSSGDSGGIWAQNPRAAVPSRPSVIVPSASQTGLSVQQPPSLSEISSQVRTIIGNMQNGFQARSDGQPESSAVQNPSSRSGAGNDEANHQVGDLSGSGAGDLNSFVGYKPDINEKESNDVPPSSLDGGCNDRPNGEAASRSVSDSESALKPAHGSDSSERATAVPLGLGLGGLQPKKRSSQPRVQGKANDATTSDASVQNQQTISDAQQILQSLASMSSRRNTDSIPSPGPLSASDYTTSNASVQNQQPVADDLRVSQSLASMANRRNTDSIPSSRQPNAGFGHVISGGQMGGQGDDVATAMSEVLHSSAFSGLLSGVSQQTGIGSPDVLRNMLEQFTQSPGMMNTVNQIAQQFDGQDIGNMLSGMGRGQGEGGGGLDLAGMVQQMMPIVSQALGVGGPTSLQQSFSSVFSDPQLQPNAVNLSRDEESSDDLDSQIDLQPVLGRIEHQNPPEEIFRSLATTAVQTDGGRDGNGLVDELCRVEGLSSEFKEVLRQSIRERLEGEKGPSDRS